MYRLDTECHCMIFTRTSRIMARCISSRRHRAWANTIHHYSNVPYPPSTRRSFPSMSCPHVVLLVLVAMGRYGAADSTSVTVFRVAPHGHQGQRASSMPVDAPFRNTLPWGEVDSDVGSAACFGASQCRSRPRYHLMHIHTLVHHVVMWRHSTAHTEARR